MFAGLNYLLADCSSWIFILAAFFPVESLKVSFARSSGPGGQHVNKGKLVRPFVVDAHHSSHTVSTKAIVHFHIDSAHWLPEETRKRLRETVCPSLAQLFVRPLTLPPPQCATRINKNGELVVACDASRSQLQNLNEAKQKILEVGRSDWKLQRRPTPLPTPSSASTLREPSKNPHQNSRSA